jgi:O-antigen/teichoic acid export membrane protein
LSKVGNGVLIALASSNVSMVISFVASIFLARLLTPNEIGIFSVAFVFAGLLRTIRELGLSAYIVQEKELTQERLRTVFGISIVIALITGALVIALADFAGRFYNEVGVTQSLYIVGLSFLLVPFGSVTMALLRRDMRFKDMAYIDLFSVLAQNISAVVLAWLGFSFMSLAWSALLGTVVTVFCTFFYRPGGVPWMPSLRQWRHVMSFGAFSSGSSLMTYASFAASDLVLGKVLNMEAVALFNRANGLSEMLNGVIGRLVTTVGLPFFSQQHRDGVPPAPAFVAASAMITMVTTPVYAVLAVVAEPTVLILFGPQWTESVIVLQILCIAAILRGPGFLTSQVMTAVGGVRQQFSLDAQGLLLRIGAVIGCASFGLPAVAWGFSLAGVINVVMKLQALNKLIGCNWKDLWPIAKHGLVSAGLSLVGPVLVVLAFPTLPAVLTLLVAGLTATIGWLAAVFLTSNPLKPSIVDAMARIRKRLGWI